MPEEKENKTCWKEENVSQQTIQQIQVIKGIVLTGLFITSARKLFIMQKCINVAMAYEKTLNERELPVRVATMIWLKQIENESVNSITWLFCGIQAIYNIYLVCCVPDLMVMDAKGIR